MSLNLSSSSTVTPPDPLTRFFHPSFSNKGNKYSFTIYAATSGVMLKDCFYVLPLNLSSYILSGIVS